MMRESIVYNLVNHRLDPSVPEYHFRTDPEEPIEPHHLFEEVYTTRNRMVRIYKVN